jgi:hypothetical protein
MMTRDRRAMFCAVAVSLSVVPLAAEAAATDNRAMAERLRQAAEVPHVEVIEFGRSVRGEPLLVARASAGDAPMLRVFYIGQQHGDEPAGAEALLLLIESIAADSSQLPAGVELWAAPRVNPDGSADRQRNNANDVDLNRDHLLLSQPETQAMHRLHRRIVPDLVVDFHEFTRTTADFRRAGWMKWPLITLDTANSFFAPDDQFAWGEQIIEDLRPAFDQAGFAYHRYLVGDAPAVVGGELRPSTHECDDCRNGLGVYGGLSFIIESGIIRAAEDPDADLPKRVEANLLLARLLIDAALAEPDRLARLRDASETHVPPVIPTNTFWGRSDLAAPGFNVTDLATLETLRVPVYTLADQRVVKSVVPVALAYAIPAGPAVPMFAELLERHALPHERTGEVKTVTAEAVDLLRVEDDTDRVYHRFPGRQITRRLAPTPTDLPPGSLVVDLSALSATDARRAMVVLEPTRLYGLYQYDSFADLATDGRLPVLRVLAWAEE